MLLHYNQSTSSVNPDKDPAKPNQSDLKVKELLFRWYYPKAKILIALEGEKKAQLRGSIYLNPTFGRSKQVGIELPGNPYFHLCIPKEIQSKKGIEEYVKIALFDLDVLGRSGGAIK